MFLTCSVSYTLCFYHRLFLHVKFFWEKVRTTKITTSKTKKNSENSVDNQNVKMVFLVDQNVEKRIITTSKSKLSQRRKELITTTNITTSKRMKRTSKVSFLSDFHILTTYGVISTTYGIWFCERLALKNESLKTL